MPIWELKNIQRFIFFPLLLFFIEVARATVAQAAVSLAFLLCFAHSKKRGIQSNFSLKWEVLQNYRNWGGTKGRRKQEYKYQGQQSARESVWVDRDEAQQCQGRQGCVSEREQTPQQLHATMTWQIYSHLRCWPVVSVFPHLNKSKLYFPSDSTVHLTEDLEYVVLKID